MNRKLCWGLCAGLMLCASWYLVESVHSQEAKPTAAPDKPKPITVKVERGPIVIETTLKGTIESGEATELFLDMKSWAGPFSVKTAVPHGARVAPAGSSCSWSRKKATERSISSQRT